MKKTRLLFDATLISEYAKKNSRRTGVYFVEYNLFLKMSEGGLFDILLYCRPNCIQDLKNVLGSSVFKGCDFRILNDLSGFTAILGNLWRFFDCYAESNRITRVIRNRIYRLLFYLNTKELSEKLEREEIDAYFSSETVEMPFSVFENPKIKKYMVVNDVIPLIFPEYFEGARKGRKHPAVKALEQLNTGKEMYAIAISEHTKKDLVKLLEVSRKNNVMVAHLACNGSFVRCTDGERIKGVKRRYGIPESSEYVLCLCTLEPRKNLKRAAEAFVRFIRKNDIKDLYLVLCGSSWDDFIKKLENSIDDLGDFKKNIIRTGYVEDADVPVLYSGAKWFVYTSQYEGFGLPPLEAMSCGCPVVTSNNSSLPEVVGDAGIMIDYDSIEQHIEAYERMYYDEAFRKRCMIKGLEQAGRFSWDKCCSRIEDFISKEEQK